VLANDWNSLALELGIVDLLLWLILVIFWFIFLVFFPMGYNSIFFSGLSGECLFLHLGRNFIQIAECRTLGSIRHRTCFCAKPI
jgi:hypothetical protein